MKGNLLLFVSLLTGILVGMTGVTPHWLLNPQLPMLLLELLIVQVGMVVQWSFAERLSCGGQWFWLLLALVGAHQSGQGGCRRFCRCQPTCHDRTAGQYRARDGIVAQLPLCRSPWQWVGCYQCGGHLFHGCVSAFHSEQHGQQALYAHRHLPWPLPGGERSDTRHLLLQRESIGGKRKVYYLSVVSRLKRW